MLVSRELCNGCEACIPYCPVGAVSLDREGLAAIDQDACVECGICYRSGVCPVDALVMQELEWPRILRSQFSDPVVEHPGTGILGRGTEEIKTNEVTGRFRRGRVGMAVEMGRPGVGSSFREVEIVTIALAREGACFEPMNPVTQLMKDASTGKLRDDILDERVLSAIIEMEMPQDRLPQVLRAAREAAAGLETVFSLGVALRVRPENLEWVLATCGAMGFNVLPNGKTNVGLGFPLFPEED
ncbi:MAG: 4Fe-4S binding protein [bacterium]|nr:4Fe-4S binding protein [bacterium]